MIVVLHSDGLFGLPKNMLSDFPLEQGVSFFFVLSGFILTYVYPDLKAAGARRRFIWARIARIWPLHFATFLAAAILLPQSALFPYTDDIANKLGIAVANVLLVQSYIPNISYYFGFNSVSWSISTEMFFYICFVFLIRDWRNTWSTKLLAVFCIMLLMFLLSNAALIPNYRPGYLGVTTAGIFYIHPASRLFEFVLGMAAGLYFLRLLEAPERMRIDRLWATFIEILSIVIVIAAMAMTLRFEQRVDNLLGHAGLIWLGNGGTCFFYASLILIFAVGRGWLSRLLSMRVFVLLGEISFSIYMVHQILIRLYIVHGGKSLAVHPAIQYSLYWLAVVVVSYLAWALVEKPARRFLVRRAPVAAPASGHSRSPP